MLHSKKENRTKRVSRPLRCFDGVCYWRLWAIMSGGDGGFGGGFETGFAADFVAFGGVV